MISLALLMPVLALAQVQSTNLVVETRPADVLAVQAAPEALPTTLVQAAPLTESRADRIRKQREAAEMNTEMMIVEQLEADRIAAERERAQRLFGLGKEEQHVVPHVAPVVHQEPQPNLQEEIQEIKSLLDKQNEVVEVESAYVHKPVYKDEKENFAVSLNLGAGSYPGVDNIESQYAAGASFAVYYDYGLILELNYTNSNYKVFTPIDPFNRVDLDQHAIAANVKYRIFDGRFSPTIGGLISYTRRNYTLDYPTCGNFCFNSLGNGTEASSSAIDIGFILGGDINVSERVSLGVDMKYIFNLTNQIDNQYQNAFTRNNTYYLGGQPIEELDQLILGFNVAFKF